MKKLLFENTQAIRTETASIVNNVPMLNKLQAFFKEHRLGELNYDVIHELLSDPARLIRNVIKSRIPDHDVNTGLKVDKDKMISSMQLPQADADLLYLIGINVVNKNYLALFDFGDTVELNQDRLRTYFDKYRIFADNAEVLKAYDELNEIAGRLNKLNAKLELMPLTDHTYGNSDFFFKSLTEIFIISPDGLRLESKGFQRAVSILLKKQKQIS